MAPLVLRRDRTSRARRRPKKAAEDGSYFAGEVIRILGLRHLDYDQLHRLFDIVRGRARAKSDEDSWRRFNFTDLANIKVAAELIGIGSRRTQRLRLKQLDEICKHLRKEFGLEHPLLHTRMRAAGSTILVELEGRYFDAGTTQRVFDAVTRDVDGYERDKAKARSPATAVAKPSRPRSAGEGSYEAPALRIGKVR